MSPHTPPISGRAGVPLGWPLGAPQPAGSPPRSCERAQCGVRQSGCGSFPAADDISKVTITGTVLP